jgi:hypothetical protein
VKLGIAVDEHIDPTSTEAERGFERVDRPRPLRFLAPDPVEDDADESLVRLALRVVEPHRLARLQQAAKRVVLERGADRVHPRLPDEVGKDDQRRAPSPPGVKLREDRGR